MSVTPLVSAVCVICVLLFNNIVSVSCQCSTPLTLTATNDFSSLTSPGYSTGLYDNGLSCSWIINSGSASNTILIFIKDYAVTAPDKIIIYNGFSTSNSTLTSGLSGTGTNTDFKTTGQYALVVLQTDSSGQAKGFRIEYMKAADLSGTGCTSEQTITATTTANYLTSPSFPNSYTDNSHCRWVIQATEGVVEFDLLLSDIESSPNCGFDYLKIYDSAYLCEHTLTINACTRYPGTTALYRSNGTSILVLFESDATVGYKGFKLKFTAIPTATTAATIAAKSDSSSFGLGIGVGFASGFITAFLAVGLILVIKRRVKTSQLGSPRVRNVLPMQTPTSLNGHAVNGSISNGHLPRDQRISIASSQSSSGNSSRNGRTPSTGNNSPIHNEMSIKNNNNNSHKRNGVSSK